MTRGAAVRLSLNVLVFSVIWAWLCNLVLSLLQEQKSIAWVFKYAFGAKIFYLNVFVIWLLILLVLAVTGRLWVTFATTLTLAVFIGAVNRQKLELRREPLYPSDIDFLRDPSFLVQMVPVSRLILVLGGLVLLFLLIWLPGRRLARHFPAISRRLTPRLWWGTLALRLVTVVGVIALLASIAQFNRPGNWMRSAYEANDVIWRFHFQEWNYHDNGFVGGFLYNLPGPAMRQPEGYSEARMRQIANRYAAVSEEMSSGRTRRDDINIVFVLSEAFSDPTRLKGVRLPRDPLPYMRTLFPRTASGEMLAQLFGGGTANMEFEALTGQSLASFLPQLNTPYQMLLPQYDEYPSIVGMLKSRGYQAIAIHPYMTSMYKRETVYPTLGFDDFVYDETMQRTNRIDNSKFIDDDSAFDEVAYQIETTESPLFINLVTMQNHVPMLDTYDDPDVVPGLSGDAKKHAGNYLRGLTHTDKALKSFLQTLEKSDEPTAVVLYGDHLPAFWPEEVFRVNNRRAMRETSWFMWSNVSGFPSRDEPTTSPIHFAPMLFDLLGQPMPPYYALLTELRREIPAMEQDMFIDSANRTVRERGLSPRARELLADYRMVQYDFSVGRRYAVDEMFYPMAAARNSTLTQADD